MVLTTMLLPNLVLAGVSEAVAYLSNPSQTQDAWITMALVAAGEPGLTGDHLKSVNSENAIDYCAPILAITALGEDPRTYPNQDYVAKLKTFWDGTQLGNSAYLNDDIFGLLALISSGESTHNTVVTGIKEYLLSQQNQDGGWGFSVGGDSDTNMTSMATMALLETGVSSQNAVITNAITYLQDAQNSDGGFPWSPTSPWGKDSDASSDAWVISAIYALDQNPEAGNWVSDTGHNPVEHLLTLQTETGFFEYQTGSGEDSFSPVTTSYAVVALSGKTFPVGYYKVPAQGPALNVHLVIKGEAGIICDTNVRADTALNTIVNAAEICGYTYNIQDSSFGQYLSQINDEAAAGAVGWLYYVNSVLPNVGAADYSLFEGDEVLWYYGEWGWDDITLLEDGASEIAITVDYPISITVPSTVTDATVNVSALKADDGNKAVATVPEITLNVTTSLSATPVKVIIPANTTITAPTGWSGIINAPRIESNDSITVVPDSGNKATISSVIEVGYGDVELTFNKAVRLLIPEASGKYAGYSRGGNFTKITATCSADSQAAGEALTAGGDCKIDVSSDLIVWTKHFTKFVTYTQTEISAPTGGGGFIPTTYCVSIEYDEWQNVCVDGQQYRNVLSLTPVNCTLTGEQENKRKRTCVEDQEEKNNAPEEEEIESEEEKVLGVKIENPNTSEPVENIIDAGLIYFSKVELIVADVGAKRDLVKEKEGVNKYTKPLTKDLERLSSENVNAITNFIVYGNKDTQKLGAGERAGVLNSYKSSFNKLPSTQAEWEDVIKIGSKILPDEINLQAEDKAKIEFKKVYERDVDMDNSSDKTAVEMIAYGLRPEKRNLDSERVGIRAFIEVYNYLPTVAMDWDIIRAIAYSGVKKTEI